MKDAKKWASGFTIVELIVVIVVIGILVALVMISYTAVVNNAHLQQVNGDAEMAASTLSRYKADNGAYPSSLSSVTITNTQSTYQYSFNATNDTYCLTATFGNLSVFIQNGTNTPTQGACPGHGVNGVAPITNLLTNPGAETGTTNWVGTNATISQSNAQVYDGSNAIKVVTNGSVAAEGVIGVVPSPGTMPGNTYSSGIWVWAPTGSQLYVVTRTSGAVAQDSPQTIINGNNAWQFFTANGKVAQSDATSLQIHVRTKSVQSVTFYIDDGMVIQGNQVTSYKDGNSPNWVWNGTANASTSTGPQ